MKLSSSSSIFTGTGLHVPGVQIERRKIWSLIWFKELNPIFFHILTFIYLVWGCLRVWHTEIWALIFHSLLGFVNSVKSLKDIGVSNAVKVRKTWLALHLILFYGACDQDLWYHEVSQKLIMTAPAGNDIKKLDFFREFQPNFAGIFSWFSWLSRFGYSVDIGFWGFERRPLPLIFGENPHKSRFNFCRPLFPFFKPAGYGSTYFSFNEM